MRLYALNLAKLRYRHHIRQAVRIVFWLVIATLISLGAYSAMTEYRWATTEAQNALKKADADRQEVLDVLSGKLVMIEQEGRYAQVAKVEWQLVEVVK